MNKLFKILMVATSIAPVLFTYWFIEQVNQWNERISEDEDINEYLHEFVKKNKDKINAELLNEFYQTIPNLKVPVPPPPF